MQENDRFRIFINERNREQIDEKVQKLTNAITPLIDCTQCGNCCKSLMIQVSEPEAITLSKHLNQPLNSFEEQYLEKGSTGLLIMNRIPCAFLSKNKCTVYEFRFEGCKEFPALHLPNFKDRLFTTFMHYERCPIIFNVVEALKDEMNFDRNAPA